MAGTTWSPMTRFEPCQWMLANGEIIQEPPLESTPSGRKVRVAGTTESVYSSELNELLQRAADKIAADRGTTVWFQGVPNMFKEALTSAALQDKRASLHLLTGSGVAQTQAWWRFKHPETAFEVLVSVAMWTQHNTTVVRSQVTIPHRAWGESWSGHARYSSYYSAEDVPDVFRLLDNYNAWFEFVRDNDPEWPQFGMTHHPVPRKAVKAFLEKVREIEDLADLKVPDMSSADGEPRYVVLEPYGSNVSAEFISELTEYLDGAPTVERAAEIYKELLSALQNSGIAVSDKVTENDFLAALVAGESVGLNIPVNFIADEGLAHDHGHRLTIHMPTGTFAVECDYRDRELNAVAEKWDEARTMASLTGEEDELLAFAKAYSEKKAKRRTERILKERTS